MQNLAPWGQWATAWKVSLDRLAVARTENVVEKKNKKPEEDEFGMLTKNQLL